MGSHLTSGERLAYLIILTFLWRYWKQPASCASHRCMWTSRTNKRCDASTLSSTTCSDVSSSLEARNSMNSFVLDQRWSELDDGLRRIHCLRIVMKVLWKDGWMGWVIKGFISRTCLGIRDCQSRYNYFNSDSFRYRYLLVLRGLSAMKFSCCNRIIYIR